MEKKLSEQIEEEYRQDPSKYLEHALELSVNEIFETLMLSRLMRIKPKNREIMRQILSDEVEIITDNLYKQVQWMLMDYGETWKE